MSLSVRYGPRVSRTLSPFVRPWEIGPQAPFIRETRQKELQGFFNIEEPGGDTAGTQSQVGPNLKPLLLTTHHSALGEGSDHHHPMGSKAQDLGQLKGPGPHLWKCWRRLGKAALGHIQAWQAGPSCPRTVQGKVVGGWRAGGQSCGAGDELPCTPGPMPAPLWCPVTASSALLWSRRI